MSCVSVPTSTEASSCSVPSDVGGSTTTAGVRRSRDVAIETREERRIQGIQAKRERAARENEKLALATARKQALADELAERRSTALANAITENDILAKEVKHYRPLYMEPRIPISSCRPPPFRPPPENFIDDHRSEALISPRASALLQADRVGQLERTLVPNELMWLAQPSNVPQDERDDATNSLRRFIATPNLDFDAKLVRARELDAKLSYDRVHRLALASNVRLDELMLSPRKLAPTFSRGYTPRAC